MNNSNVCSTTYISGSTDINVNGSFPQAPAEEICSMKKQKTENRNRKQKTKNKKQKTKNKKQKTKKQKQKTKKIDYK